jgi:hypothetical protein
MPARNWWKRVFSKSVLDYVSGLVTIVGAVVGGIYALVQYAQNSQSERSEAAEHAFREAAQAYREVDDKFVGFMRECLAHPELDCYGGSLFDAGTPLADAGVEDHRSEQHRLDTVLVDLLEFAHRRYVIQRGFYHCTFGQTTNPQAREEEWRIRETEWCGWRARTAAALKSRHFGETWRLIHQEYSETFQGFMSEMAEMDAGTPPCTESADAAPCPLRSGEH